MDSIRSNPAVSLKINMEGGILAVIPQNIAAAERLKENLAFLLDAQRRNIVLQMLIRDVKLRTLLTMRKLVIRLASSSSDADLPIPGDIVLQFMSRDWGMDDWTLCAYDQIVNCRKYGWPPLVTVFQIGETIEGYPNLFLAIQSHG